ncbi:MAG: ABC transporter ATP-binding protein [Deltaproteobacteria bacterium]|nr:MAG: ABC transporter ATP-binding protein [Deltaproteobacteria bacterium]
MNDACRAGLRATDLRVARGGREVAAVARLSAPPGRILGLMGPNGSGKSSLLRALGGLLPLSSGQVLLDGEDLLRMRPAVRAQRVACLLQRHQVAFDFTLAELVGLGCSRPDPAAVANALRRVGLHGLGSRRWSRCSGGEQQRAHLARALVTGARLLLLDEPDNHLDLGARALLSDLIRSEADRGAVVVVATHDIDLASRCDELLLLDRGRLRHQAPPAQMLDEDCFCSTFGLSADPGLVAHHHRPPSRSPNRSTP